MPTLKLSSFLTTLAGTLLCGAIPTLAQNPPKSTDEALERLLDQLESSSPSDVEKSRQADESKASKDPEESKKAKPTAPPKSAEDELERLLDQLEGAEAGDSKKPKSDDPSREDRATKSDASSEKAKDKADRSTGEISEDDKDLDSLLEKLGQTVDKPTREDPSSKPSMPGEPSEKPNPEDTSKNKGEPKRGELKGDAKELDEHLEELTGRKRKKPKQEGQGQGGDLKGEADPDNPLSDIIKEMREVEQRLGKTDTGDETRKRQTEIVKRLDTMIEQLRQSQSQSKSTVRKRTRLSMKPGEQQGAKSEQGAMGKGVGQSLPERPTTTSSQANGKDEWGHLPPELRQQMANIFKEEGLPNKAEHIRRYYLSLSKKRLTREE